MDFGNSDDFTDGFVVDDEVYGSLTGDYFMFCIIKLLTVDGKLSMLKCLNYTYIDNSVSVHFTVVNLHI